MVEYGIQGLSDNRTGKDQYRRIKERNMPKGFSKKDSGGVEKRGMETNVQCGRRTDVIQRSAQTLCQIYLPVRRSWKGRRKGVYLLQHMHKVYKVLKKRLKEV